MAWVVRLERGTRGRKKQEVLKLCFVYRTEISQKAEYMLLLWKHKIPTPLISSAWQLDDGDDGACVVVLENFCTKKQVTEFHPLEKCSNEQNHPSRENCCESDVKK